jgi:hypothetical protein
MFNVREDFNDIVKNVALKDFIKIIKLTGSLLGGAFTAYEFIKLTIVDNYKNCVGNDHTDLLTVYCPIEAAFVSAVKGVIVDAPTASLSYEGIVDNYKNCVDSNHTTLINIYCSVDAVGISALTGMVGGSATALLTYGSMSFFESFV